MEEYMTKTEVKSRLQICLRTVDKLLKTGKLKYIKIGSLVRILKSSFEDLATTYEVKHGKK